MAIKRLIWKATLVTLAFVLAALSAPILVLAFLGRLPTYYLVRELMYSHLTWPALGAVFLLVFVYFLIRFREDNWGGLWLDGPEDADELAEFDPDDFRRG